ncbi:MAG: nucleoside-diphosphate sugar epimerase/dehydratase [Pseudomonadota bacterium]
MEQSLAARLLDRIVGAPRLVKQAVELVSDACALTFVACAIPWLYGLPLHALLVHPDQQIFLALYVPIGLVILWYLDFYKMMIRRLDRSFVQRTILAFFGLSLLAAAIFLDRTSPIKALALGVICGGMSIGLIALSRIFARALFDLADPRAAGAVPILIYGAGQAGTALAETLKDDPSYRAVALIDDDPSLRNLRIGGLTVHPVRELDDLRLRHGANQVAIAIPSLGRARRRAIMEQLIDEGFEVLSVPAFADLMAGRLEVSDLRKINVAELLGRDVVDLAESRVHRWFEGRTVLITGAGGTIGAEVARQIARLGVARLILFDAAEPALYEIHQELKDLATGIELVPVLGSVTDPVRLDMVFSERRIDAVFHAAAYKHVPLVEANALAGIRNNVLGTEILAEAAGRARVNRFILISTDKAVRPTNVMGATKRLAELSVGAAQERHKGTIFSLVRFGNVLGSSGSVIPRFEQQIMRGGPVTVTHPEITRYFMTIPEAAQLVITAGLQANGGEVFVLDMGEPIKILDLARRMIRLSGATVKDSTNPDGEIEIHFSGLRPGEKLFEELLIGEDTVETPHPKIFVAHESQMQGAEMATLIGDLTRAVENRALADALRLIEATLPDYTPSEEISDVAEGPRSPRDASAFGPPRIVPGGRD